LLTVHVDPIAAPTQARKTCKQKMTII